jgi:hypothetical protein
VTPKRLAALALVLALVGAGAVALVLTRGESRTLEQLGRAQRAGSRARELSADVADNLERLASNLRAGAELGTKSERIHDLTSRQRFSLEELIRLLRAQLEAIDRSASLVERTRRSSASLAEISETQARLIRRAVRALRRLRATAAEAGAISADVAVKAVYGARLAEDSQRAFSRP